MHTFFIVAILVLGFLITFQIAKASEYVAVLRGEERSRKQSNKINAFMLLMFLIVGLIGVYYCNEKLKGNNWMRHLGKPMIGRYRAAAVAGFALIVTLLLFNSLTPPVYAQPPATTPISPLPNDAPSLTAGYFTLTSRCHNETDHRNP